MAYHILPPPAAYRRRLVLCHQTGPLHRHERHEEVYTTALCGAEVVKDSGGYCDLASFATLSDRGLHRPVGWRSRLGAGRLASSSLSLGAVLTPRPQSTVPPSLPKLTHCPLSDVDG